MHYVLPFLKHSDVVYNNLYSQQCAEIYEKKKIIDV